MDESADFLKRYCRDGGGGGSSTLHESADFDCRGSFCKRGSTGLDSEVAFRNLGSAGLGASRKRGSAGLGASRKRVSAGIGAFRKLGSAWISKHGTASPEPLD